MGNEEITKVHEEKDLPHMLMAVTILCIAVIIYYIGDAALL